MKRIRRGFTLVEVSLFLAITAAIFVSIAIGTQNSIFQQRYNDAVQSFAEFLRTVYSQVTNVQNESVGRSDKAIYGKLVVFGDEGGNNNITSYNVIGGIGNVGSSSSTEVLEKLKSLGASITDTGGPVGYVENYKPRWGSQIQTNRGWGAVESDKYQLFTGALLIVRHPSSGTVYTYTMKDNNDLYEAIKSGSKDPLIGLLDGDNFKLEEVNFCINPNGAERSNLRRDVRIVEGARNASGIEIMPDGEECD